MILVDSHVLLWWMEGGQRLSARVAAALEEMAPVLVSPVSFWEVAMLVERGRVAVDRDVADWAHDVLNEGGVELAPLTPTAAVSAARLRSFPGDPADRFLYATARELGARLASKDRRLRDHARRQCDVRVIW